MDHHSPQLQWREHEEKQAAKSGMVLVFWCLKKSGKTVKSIEIQWFIVMFLLKLWGP